MSQPPIPLRLRENYHKIKEIGFVKEKVQLPTSQELAEFSEILNGSLPQTPEESGVSNLVRFQLTRADQKGYNLWTRELKMPQALLWSDAKTIIRHFKLGGKVHIRYDKDAAKYQVSFHHSIAV